MKADTKKLCIRCGAEAERKFWLNPQDPRDGHGEWCCERCFPDACTASVTGTGINFARGLAWLRAEGRARKAKP